MSPDRVLLAVTMLVPLVCQGIAYVVITHLALKRSTIKANVIVLCGPLVSWMSIFFFNDYRRFVVDPIVAMFSQWSTSISFLFTLIEGLFFYWGPVSLALVMSYWPRVPKVLIPLLCGLGLLSSLPFCVWPIQISNVDDFEAMRRAFFRLALYSMLSDFVILLVTGMFFRHYADVILDLRTAVEEVQS